MTIYVDVLLILNIYVNFLLIKTTAKFTHCKIGFMRCMIASVYGSLYSLLILLPDLNKLLNIAIKIIAAVTIIIISFGIHNASRLFINILCFLTSNFIFAGVIYGVYIWFNPSFIHFNNTFFYVDFSIIILIAVTAALYLSLCIARYFLDKNSAVASAYQIYIKYKGKVTALNGLADTGNSLVDFFSGKPVIICSRESLNSVITFSLNYSETEKLPKGFRLIPYSTIGNNGMMPIFTPDEILIINRDTNSKKQVDALIGIQSDGTNAIFNPRLLKL